MLNKPIYAGMCILDLSKLHMYKFHYDVIKAQYGSNAKLLVYALIMSIIVGLVAMDF